jgi:Domain of unknown function (DUF4037)
MLCISLWLPGPRRGDWLVSPQQRLLEVPEGAVFHDGLGEFDVVRKALALYAADV